MISRFELVKRLTSGPTWWSSAIEKVPPFVPGSDQYWRYPDVTLDGASRFPEQMLELILETAKPPLELDAKDLRYQGDRVDAARETFVRFGSNKHTVGLEYVYGHILSTISSHDVSTILEIGIGTQLPHAISTMGPTWSPGGSLRALAELFPSSKVYGGDIDESIFFHEERIECLYIDQLDQDSLAAAVDRISNQVDICVDDGLHAPIANLNTLLALRGQLKHMRFLCIEDISPCAIDVWRLVGSVIQLSGISCAIIQVESGQLVFLATGRAGHSFGG